VKPQAEHTYRVGRYLVDLSAGRVSENGQHLNLNWRSFQALRLLVEARGNVVARDELFRRLWPDAEVDESSLAKCISQLRRALTSGNSEEEYLETIPRIGYRLLVPVEELTEPAVTPRRGRWLQVLLAAAALLALVAGGWIGWRWWQGRSRILAAEAALAKGQELLRKKGPGGAAEGMPYLRRAVEINPQSALAYSTLAHAIHRLGQSGLEKASGPRTTAIEAAERAIALDPKCGACQGTLGFLLFYHGWQWAKGEQHLREAIRLSPDQASIRPSYAMLLAATGRLPEALEQIEHGLRASPYQVTWHSIRAAILYSMRRYPEAIAAADQSVSIDREETAGWEWRSRALFQLGRPEEALRSLAHSTTFSSHAPELQAAYRQGGADAGLRKLLEVTEGWQGRTHRSRRAGWKALLKDTEGTIDELEAAYELHNLGLLWIAVDPAYDRLRAHPRFQKILADMGLRG